MASRLRFLIATLALSFAGADAFAESPNGPQFSADIVNRDQSGAVIGGIGKLHMAGRKVRIEIPDQAGGFFLTDPSLGAALFVRPAQHIFLDAKQSSPLTRVFLPVDPNDPCPQWRAAAMSAGITGADGDWHCERIDAPVIDGRRTIEYRVVSPDRNSSELWVNPDLGLPLKLRNAGGRTVTLEHLQLVAQPADLFEIPPDYRKFDPQALIERIKRSDVWVEQPK